MIVITDEQMDDMAERIWQSEKDDHPYDPDNVYPLAVYRKALDAWFVELIDGMIQDVVDIAYGPNSRGAYMSDVRRIAAQVTR